MSWLRGPIAAFDLEATGVNVETDRIVSFCVGMFDGRKWHESSGIVNPSVEIPAAATAVHGITDEMARAGWDTYTACSEIRGKLYDAWENDVPVVIFNAPYDTSLLDRECRRNGIGELQIRGSIIDPLCLDKQLDRFRRGSRKLVDTCRHYGVTLSEEDAHSGSGDCLAAARLAWVLATKHGLGGMSLEDLHNSQVGWFAKQRSSFADYRRKQGKPLDDESLDWPLIPYTADVLQPEVPMSIDELAGLYADLGRAGMTSHEVLEHRE